jgi:hypothetical protein
MAMQGLRPVRVLVLASLIGTTGSATAEDHAHHRSHAGHDEPVLSEHRHGYGASLSVLLADYDARLFSGEYQGTRLGGWWMQGRFGVAASLPAYRLTKNGRAVDGIGDAMVHGHAMLWSRGRVSVDGMLMVTAPTGDGDAGLGMGHVMVMPEVGARVGVPRASLAARVGYGHMAGGSLAHAEHGQKMWPLVEPMNAAELTFGATGLVALSRGLAVGVQGQGALPIGDGDTRVVGGVRVVWSAGRAETSLQLDHGFVGSPFGLRGVLETSVRFD